MADIWALSIDWITNCCAIQSYRDSPSRGAVAVQAVGHGALEVQLRRGPAGRGEEEEGHLGRDAEPVPEKGQLLQPGQSGQGECRKLASFNPHQ